MNPIQPITLPFYALIRSKVAGNATRIFLQRDLYTGSLGSVIAKRCSTSGANVGSVTSKAKQQGRRMWSVGDIVWVRPKDCYRLKKDGLKPQKPAHRLRHPMVVVNIIYPFLQLLPCSHALPKPLLLGSGIANNYTLASKGFFVDKKKHCNFIPTRISLRVPLYALSHKATSHKSQQKSNLPTPRRLHTADLQLLLKDTGLPNISTIIVPYLFLSLCN